jgi:hypothetical protein
MGPFLRRLDARLGKSNKKTKKKETTWISQASPSTGHRRRCSLDRGTIVIVVGSAALGRRHS